MINVIIKTLDSQNHSFSVEDDEITVRGFKEYIAETVTVPADSQRLIYCGRVLQDDKKLNDYDVNGKVIHLVQRAPPQPEARSNTSSNENQRSSTNGWGPGVRYRIPAHRNTMYLGAMSVPAEVVEGLPAPQLSNTLSNSRLLAAKKMLNRAMRLMDRLDNPALPLHPSASENAANAETQSRQTSGQEESSDQRDGNEAEDSDSQERSSQRESGLEGATFSGATLINIRLINDQNGDVENLDTVNIDVTPPDEPQEPTQEPERQQESVSANSNNAEGQSSRRSTPHMPRPPQMAELLQKLIETQNRLQPYIERYQTLMSSDPVLSQGTGPESVQENQKVIDGVSECLHFISHACHALSDIIVDMGQQPPRNLRCRPIIIQHSAILQAGIPIQVEGRVVDNTNNATDNSNETTSSSPPTRASEPANRPSSNEQSSRNNQQSAGFNFNTPQSLLSQTVLGSLLNLPGNVEVSISPTATVEVSAEMDTSADEQRPSNNNNDNGSSNFPMGPPFAFIRDAIQSVVARHARDSQLNSNHEINNVTVIQHTIDSNATNQGQSTQARSNITTHPTTSTQTRSTARPHVLHSHSHPLGVGMGQNMDFDPFLPCNSHHVHRSSQSQSASTASQTASSANQNSENQNRSQSRPASASASSRNGTSSFPNGIGLAMALGELLQEPSGNGSVHISFLGNRPREMNINSSSSSSTGNSSPQSHTSGDSLESFFRSINSQFSGIEADHFIIDMWLFLLRNISFESLKQLRSGLSRPLIDLRIPLQHFVEDAFPDEALQEDREALQQTVIQHIMSLNKPYLDNITIFDSEMNDVTVDFHKTIDSIINKFCTEFLHFLYDNDIDNATFAEEVMKLTKKLEAQFASFLRYILKGGRDGIESFGSRFLNQITNRMHPILQTAVITLVGARIKEMASKPAPLVNAEVQELLVFKNPTQMNSAGSSRNLEQQVKKEVKKLEPMETDFVPNSGGNVNDEMVENFPGQENVPADWVPIIGRDVVRQRRQLENQNKQGGPIPFSDGYLNGMPSKRRKLIEQQKTPLFVNSTTNHSTVGASVERLVKDGITHSGITDIEGAAQAVSTDPGVRSAFGQAIRDCLHPGRFTTPDFPNQKRFPNATKYFTDQSEKSPEK